MTGVVGGEGDSEVVDSAPPTFVVEAGKHPAEQTERELLRSVGIFAEPPRLAVRFDVGEAGDACEESQPSMP